MISCQICHSMLHHNQFMPLIPSSYRCRATHETNVGCRFYFAYCEAAFDARYIRNYQIVWRKTAEPATAVLAAINADLAAPPAPADPMTQVTGL